MTSVPRYWLSPLEVTEEVCNQCLYHYQLAVYSVGATMLAYDVCAGGYGGRPPPPARGAQGGDYGGYGGGTGYGQDYGAPAPPQVNS